MSNPFGPISFIDPSTQRQTLAKEAPVLCLISGSKGHLWLRRLPYLMCWWKKRRGLCKRQKSSGASWMTRSLIDWATIVEFNGSLSKRGWNLKNAPNICIIIPLQWFLCQLSRVTLLNTWIFKIGYGPTPWTEYSPEFGQLSYQELYLNRFLAHHWDTESSSSILTDVLVLSCQQYAHLFQCYMWTLPNSAITLLLSYYLIEVIPV